jgi:hypothetical protein
MLSMKGESESTKVHLMVEIYNLTPITARVGIPLI